MWWRRWFYIREINLDKRRGEYVRRSTENIPPFLTITSWNWKLRFDFATKRRKSCSGTLPLWNRKHRFLQKNNVATVSEEAAVKMKNTHSTQGERNRKKQKKREWDTDFFSFSSLPPVKFLQEATLHALSIAPNNFVMMYAKYNPTWAAYLAMETTRQALYCQNFSSSISWQISYFLLRIFTQDWAIGPHTLLH